MLTLRAELLERQSSSGHLVFSFSLCMPSTALLHIRGAEEISITQETSLFQVRKVRGTRTCGHQSEFGAASVWSDSGIRDIVQVSGKLSTLVNTQVRVPGFGSSLCHLPLRNHHHHLPHEKNSYAAVHLNWAVPMSAQRQASWRSVMLTSLWDQFSTNSQQLSLIPFSSLSASSCFPTLSFPFVS